MNRMIQAGGLRCGVVAAILGSGCLPVHALLYRCPTVQGNEMVVTNLVSEADATARACEPLQARRSPLDGPPRTAAVPVPSAAARFSDDWMHAKPAAPGHSQRRRASPEPTAPRPADSGAAPADSRAAPADSRAADERVVPKEVQRARDSDARTILAAELGREEQKLVELKQRAQAAAAGSAERTKIDEALTRHASDADSIKREIARLR